MSSGSTVQPTGWIKPADRDATQQAAHAAAVSNAKAFSLPIPALAKGESIRLYKLHEHPDVLADVGGKVVHRWWQKTGSCVKAGGFIALYSTICAQRVVSDTPTKAFLPFCWHNYAESRHLYGDDGKGEGSMGSTFWKSLDQTGVADLADPNIKAMCNPQFGDENALHITANEELYWSSIRSPNVKVVMQTTTNNTIATMGECKTVGDIRSMVSNGYGVAFACNNNISRASIKGSGADAVVMGKWDSPGGHQESIHAVYEHPQFGPLYWTQNNWPASVYPRDPFGGPACGCWVTEKDTEYALLRLDAEVYGYSHLDWFPAAPKLLDFLV